MTNNSRNVARNAYDMVKSHMETTGSISIRDAMAEHGLSGGHLTKLISTMRRDGLAITSEWRRNPITGRRYKRYSINPAILAVQYVSE